MTDFLTVEDVNSIVAEYYNTPFWDSMLIDFNGTNDFTDYYFDYFKVTRVKTGNNYMFTISVVNDFKTGQFYFVDANNNWLSNVSGTGESVSVLSPTNVITIYCQLFVQSNSQSSFYNVSWIVEDVTPKVASIQDKINVTVTLKEVNPNFNVNGKTFNVNGKSVVCSNKQLKFDLPYNNGYNCIIGYNGVSVPVFIYGHIKNINIIDVPSDLLLVTGRNNTFNVISDSSNLGVECEYPASVEGKTVRLNLDDKNDVKPFNLIVRTNEDNQFYSNQYSFRVHCDYFPVRTMQDLTNLIDYGGVGKLENNITLTGNVLVKDDTSIIGNNHNINCNNHKFIIDEDLTFKADNINFSNGENTIQQNTGSKVELTNCSFTGCTGLGSVIDCQVDINSLTNPTDYYTSLTGCSISDCDMAILHGGNLNMEKCIVNGKIGDKDYPYALYQTDGEAVILNTNFSLTHDSRLTTDLQFNTCVFTCGENAIINGLAHTDLENNNVTGFIEQPQFNSSVIDVEYYYELISDYIRLQSDNGFCHAVSGVDYVFKTNVKPVREG